MDYQHWLREAISQLQASESPRRDAEILLEFVTGKGRTFILAFGETAGPGLRALIQQGSAQLTDFTGQLRASEGAAQDAANALDAN